jgi:tetratricopeptide (TPR) repeat protein
LLTPLGRATVEASLGALAQTQIELSQYRWPDVPIQDALRRAGLVDLGVAEAYYHRALAIDPSNATANRRLGQIELAREQFDAACPHLAAAYQTLPQQRATRQLLGECNAVSGRPEEAAKLWKTVDVGQSQLNIRRWWYDEYLQDQGHAAQFQVAMNVLAGE